MKKHFGILFLVLLCASVVISAQEANPASDFEYDLNSDEEGIMIKKYIDSATEVVIPSVIEDFPVVELESDSFKESHVVSVIISDTVQEIWLDAFNGCTSLARVTIGKGIQTIKDGAFRYCSSLTTFNIGVESVTYYQDHNNPNSTFRGYSSLSLKEKAKIKKTGYRGYF